MKLHLDDKVSHVEFLVTHPRCWDRQAAEIQFELGNFPYASKSNKSVWKSQYLIPKEKLTWFVFVCCWMLLVACIYFYPWDASLMRENSTLYSRLLRKAK